LQAEDGIRDFHVTGVQTCALPILEAVDRILAATPRPNDFSLLRELSRKMSDTALCNLEARAPNPLLSTLARFPDEYRAHAERGEIGSASCRERVENPVEGGAVRIR